MDSMTISREIGGDVLEKFAPKGWDGTINGRMAADGAYFYVVRALGTDADKNAGYSMKASYKKQKASGGAVGVYQLSGDINLLRCRK